MPGASPYLDMIIASSAVILPTFCAAKVGSVSMCIDCNMMVDCVMSLDSLQCMRHINSPWAGPGVASISGILPGSLELTDLNKIYLLQSVGAWKITHLNPESPKETDFLRATLSLLCWSNGKYRCEH